ncbi:MAG: carbohydrate kinase family protein, partial [Candidatus Izemoplasmatales bacterium]
TGAGDNFNAGFVLGLLLGLEPDEALLTGMSTSGYYVRNADSPTFADLNKFITDWANNKI